MVISHRKKYVYFVIPKCGSTTIRKALESFTDVGYPVSHFTRQHVTMKQFVDSEFGGCFSQYFKFTFIRNPYDRIYSGFLQDLHASKNYPRWIECKSPIFKDIGEDFNRYIQEYVSKSDLNNDWRWVCFCPMHQFTHMEGSHAIDFIGRTEALHSDFARLCKHIDVEEPPNLVNYNVNTEPAPSYKYLDRYERKTVEIINELYSEDFKRFGYMMMDPSFFSRKAA